MTHQQLNRNVSLPVLGSDDTGCHVLHVDMDAFFASVEVRDRPQLRGRPVIVGGLNRRGVVTSATYEARQFGVHSAMSMARAMNLCPQATVIPVDHAKYRHASKQVMSILADFSPQLSVVSVDEAFLDVSSVRGAIGAPTQIAGQIRQRLAQELSLPSSVGIARNASVAKIASTLAKPAGQMLVPDAQTVEFLHALPVRSLTGVGKATASALRSLGIDTVAEIVAVPPSALAAAVGRKGAARLVALANGQESTQIGVHRSERSISAERTFESDVSDYSLVQVKLREETELVFRRLRKASLIARTVSIKLRFDDFQTIERSHTLPTSTTSAIEAHPVVDQLLNALWDPARRVRLVGIRLSGLADIGVTGEQLTLADVDSTRHVVDEVADEVVARFGRGALTSGRLVAKGNEEQK